jgi:nucleoside-diphosphate-sugar epimerase
MKRRQFVRCTLKIAAGLCAVGLTDVRRLCAAVPSKRVLVIGGTNFVGPAVVEAALTVGHRVTLFNRGVSNPGMFPYLEQLRGFRSTEPTDQAFGALDGRRWDAVVDVWPNDPEMVTALARHLKDRVGHYLFVSSTAAYADQAYAKPGFTEAEPLRPFSRDYSGRKAESERRLQELVGDKLTIVRPGAISGYRDTWISLRTWLLRAEAGGRHIGPGSGKDFVQVVDSKDVGRFLVDCIGQSSFGTFNLTGETLLFDDFLRRCNAVTRSNAEFVWVPSEYLLQRGLQPRTDFPFWRPGPGARGVYQISSEKAVRLGWTRRPFEETALDCLRWTREEEAMNPPSAGRPRWTDPLTPARETAILSEWASRRP